MTNVASAVSNTADTDVAVETCLTTIETELGTRDVDFVLVGVSPQHDYETLIKTLRTETDNAPLIGASSAGEFSEDGAVSGGLTVAAIVSDSIEFSVGLGTALSDDVEAGVDAAIDELDGSLREQYAHTVGINLHNGLLGLGDEVTLRPFQRLGVPFVGGSAADDRRITETVVFANDRIAPDGIALALLGSEQPFRQAVGFGHERLSEGMVVTDSEGSVVHEIDGEPAYDRWARVVRPTVATEYDFALADVSPDDPAWVDLLTRYEFGIETGEDSHKIRWPGLTPDRDDSLHFATKIPEDTELFVMDARPADERVAQRDVVNSVLSGDDDIAGALSFACICQSNILGDEFDAAVQETGEKLAAPLSGFEVYGEVNVTPEDMRGYHNASLSLLAIPA